MANHHSIEVSGVSFFICVLRFDLLAYYASGQYAFYIQTMRGMSWGSPLFYSTAPPIELYQTPCNTFAAFGC